MPIAKPSATSAPGLSALMPLCDRRSDHRMQTVFRVARVITWADEGLARIRNLSDYGACLSLSLPTSQSDSVILELADRVELRGKIVWTQDHRVGLQFEQPIDCRELLATLADTARSSGTRPVRLPLAVTALTRSERGLRCTKVIDISLRGLKLVHDGSLTKGLQIKVMLPSGLDRTGVVRWSRDGRAGVMLLDHLSVEALGSMRRLMLSAESAAYLPPAAHELQA